MATPVSSFDRVSPSCVPLPGNEASSTFSGITPFLELVGESPSTRRLRVQIERIGPHFRTLLLQGEMGTGKEMVARALHAQTRDGGSTFSTCHGAALAEEIESSRIPGSAGSCWEPVLQGTQGTIFLDGVDDMTLRAQAHLLDAVSGWTRRRTQPRLVAASRQDLRRMLGGGRFRPDLYHRLAAIELVIEPLRRRREDIPWLATRFLEEFASLYARGVTSISHEAMRRIEEYDWPGNVRELENVMRNAVLTCDGHALEPQDFDLLRTLGHAAAADAIPSGEPVPHEVMGSLESVVTRHVLRVLHLCGGNKVRAAESLGISRSTLYRMLDGTEVTDGRVVQA
ncbi:MAG: sigma 54-interacting transcriptional regulator [Edaphobacter sp.]|uniref:sigma 54-interacting transcriptional regulator n=1 Tax=Edaphobacter sp. TaxID=1934404 RepID=UPI002390A1D8|nr:sigma 54-interacting transcriptional regulator [Edaphobacter sp.]MDE1175073.1 sigma 54-interacting transcriptional regulator [Edaphobacter sp.]